MRNGAPPFLLLSSTRLFLPRCKHLMHAHVQLSLLLRCVFMLLPAFIARTFWPAQSIDATKRRRMSPAPHNQSTVPTDWKISHTAPILPARRHALLFSAAPKDQNGQIQETTARLSGLACITNAPFSPLHQYRVTCWNSSRSRCQEARPSWTPCLSSLYGLPC